MFRGGARAVHLYQMRCVCFAPAGLIFLCHQHIKIVYFFENVSFNMYLYPCTWYAVVRLIRFCLNYMMGCARKKKIYTALISKNEMKLFISSQHACARSHQIVNVWCAVCVDLYRWPGDVTEKNVGEFLLRVQVLKVRTYETK